MLCDLKQRRSGLLSLFVLGSLFNWTLPAVASNCDNLSSDQTQLSTQLEQGHWQAAVLTWKSLLERCPQRSDFWLELGRLQLSLKQYEEAIQAYQQIIAIDSVTAAEPLALIFSQRIPQAPKLKHLLTQQIRSANPEQQMIALLLSKQAIEPDIYYAVLRTDSDKMVKRVALTLFMDHLYRLPPGSEHPLTAFQTQLQNDLKSNAWPQQLAAFYVLLEYLKLAPHFPGTAPQTVPEELHDELIALLKTDTVSLGQITAMQVIGQANIQSARPAVRARLKQQSQQKIDYTQPAHAALKASIKTTAQLQDQQSIPLLLDLLDYPAVQFVVISALDSLDARQSLPDLLALLPGLESGMEVNAIAKLIVRWQASEAFDALFKATEQAKNNEPYYDSIATSLAQMGGPGARALLQKHASDPSLGIEVQSGALEALGLTLAEDPGQLPIFLKALHAPERRIRLSALYALTKFAVPEAYAELEAHWQRETDSSLKQQTLEALLANPATEPLLWLQRALTDPAPGLAEEAASRLSHYTHLSGITELYAVALSSSDRELQRRALYHLPQDPIPGITLLIIEILENGDVQLRREAASKLLYYRSLSTEQALKHALYKDPDPEVVAAAKKTLRAWGYVY